MTGPSGTRPQSSGSCPLFRARTSIPDLDNWRQHRPTSFWMRRALSATFPQPKMEMTMRKKILTVCVVPLIAALTVQAAAASERHHTRTKARAVASERLRNTNAYYPAPNDSPVPSYGSNVDEGAMSSRTTWSASRARCRSRSRALYDKKRSMSALGKRRSSSCGAESPKSSIYAVHGDLRLVTELYAILVSGRVRFE